MALTPKQNRYLRGLAHKLKPVVMVGNAGITENVIQELNSSLSHHELIKVRISGMDREDRTKSVSDLCEQTNSNLVTTIGHIAVLFRPGDKPKIKLP